MKIPVKAKVYYATQGQTAIKCLANVAIGDLICINSYTVSNTIERPDRLNAFPPSYQLKNGKYKPNIEFPNSRNNPLLTAIYKACCSAYKHYEDTHKLHEYGETYEVEVGESQQTPDPRDMETIINDPNLDEPIDISNLPF